MSLSFRLTHSLQVVSATLLVSTTVSQLRASSLSYHLTIHVSKLVSQQIIHIWDVQTGTYFSSKAGMFFLLSSCSLTNTHAHYLTNPCVSFIDFPQKISAAAPGWDRSVPSKTHLCISTVEQCHQCYHESNVLAYLAIPLHCKFPRADMVFQPPFHL